MRTLKARLEWYEYLSEKPNAKMFGHATDGFPNVGPNPSIAGMRRFYGKDAYLVFCNSYLHTI